MGHLILADEQCMQKFLMGLVIWHKIIFLYFLIGLNWEEISQSVCWMSSFAKVVQRNPPVKLKAFKKVSAEDRHNIQTHLDYLDMLVCVLTPCLLEEGVAEMKSYVTLLRFMVAKKIL